MLSQTEQKLLIDLVVTGIVVVFGFAITSTLMAVSMYLPFPRNWRRKMTSIENVDTTRSAIAREQCLD